MYKLLKRLFLCIGPGVFGFARLRVETTNVGNVYGTIVCAFATVGHGGIVNHAHIVYKLRQGLKHIP